MENKDEQKQPKTPTGVALLGEACSGKSTFLDKLMFLTEQTSVLSPSYKLELSSDVGLHQNPDAKIDVDTNSDEPFFVQTLRQSLTDDAKQRCEIQYLIPEKHLSDNELTEDEQACFDSYREFHQSGRLEETQSFLLPCSDSAESSPLTTMVTKLRHGLVVHAVAKYLEETQLKTKLFQHVQHQRQTVEASYSEQHSAHQAWKKFTVGEHGQNVATVNQPADIILTSAVHQLIGRVKIVTGCGKHPRQDQIFVRNWLVQLNEDTKWAFCLDFVDVHFNSSLLAAGLFFVDTPGTNSSMDNAYATTLKAMQEANVVMLLLNRPGINRVDSQMLRACSFLKRKLLLKEQTQRTGLIVSYMPCFVHGGRSNQTFKNASQSLIEEAEVAAKKMDPTTVLLDFQQLFKIRAIRNASDELAAPPNKKRRTKGPTEGPTKPESQSDVPEHQPLTSISEPPSPIHVQHKGKTRVAYVAASIIPFVATHLNLQPSRLDDPLTHQPTQAMQDTTNMTKLLDLLKSFAEK